ncbi:MAG: restriction endonuclease subunit S [Syntrophobacteraceae bacterium]
MMRQGYPRYRMTKLPWLARVPESWGLKRIKHTTYVKGRIGWQGLRSDEFIDEGPLLITGTDFRDGKINWESCYHVTEQRYAEDSFIQVREGDLLVTKDGTIGKLAVVTGLPGPATLNSGIFLTRQITGHCLERFLFWILSSDVFTGFIDFTKAGATISHLYQNVFVEFTFPVPSVDEQHFIATFLVRETERIDALIAKKQRQIELLNEKRAALISHAVTKGLNSHARMKDSGIEWLGGIPEHWEATQLRRKSLILDCKHRTVPFTDDGIPVASIREVHGLEVNLSEAKRTTEDEYLQMIQGDRKPQIGDIIYSRNATVGEAALVTVSEPFCMGQDVCLIRARKHHARFLLYLFRSIPLMQQVESLMIGSTFRRINVDQIKCFWVCLPPFGEQQSIANWLDGQTAKLSILRQRLDAGISLLQEYRTALITAAVTGKIDVRQEATHARTAH